MIDGTVAVAFAAGLVATLNPCGFAMLPAYLAYFLHDEGDTAHDAGALHALRVGGVVAAGFLLVFGVAGIATTVALRAVVQAVPWAAMAVGIVLLAYGLAVLSGRSPQLRLPGPRRATEGRGVASRFTFGVGYAVASLSCTLPVFLSVVGGATARGTLAEGIVLFVVYAVGMSLVLLGLALAVAAGRGGLVRLLRRGSAVATRLSGGLLTLAGGYIVWFWWGSLRDPLQPRGPVQVVEGWSAWVTGVVGDHPAMVAGVLAAVVVAAVALALRHRAADPGSPTP
jgi:cytochrome c biogenesis protein CcdA